MTFHKSIIAAAIGIALSAPAHADPLGDLIQLRTVEHGETCTRSEEFGVCTLGKSADYRATYMRGPANARTVEPPMPAAELCAKFKTAGFELFTASFVRYEGEVILNCVHRKAGVQ